MLTAQYYVRGKHMGQSSREMDLVHGRLRPPDSLAYFCPTCGEVWAMVVVAGQQFRVWSMPCAKHPPPYRVVVAGSMMLDWDRVYNDALPHDVLRREVLIHAEWWKRHADVK